MWVELVLTDLCCFHVHSLATKLKQITEDYEARETVSLYVFVLSCYPQLSDS